MSANEIILSDETIYAASLDTVLEDRGVIPLENLCRSFVVPKIRKEEGKPDLDGCCVLTQEYGLARLFAMPISFVTDTRFMTPSRYYRLCMTAEKALVDWLWLATNKPKVI